MKTIHQNEVPFVTAAALSVLKRIISLYLICITTSRHDSLSVVIATAETVTVIYHRERLVCLVLLAKSV